MTVQTLPRILILAVCGRDIELPFDGYFGHGGHSMMVEQM